jgi:hypothetical protein
MHKLFNSHYLVAPASLEASASSKPSVESALLGIMDNTAPSWRLSEKAPLPPGEGEGKTGGGLNGYH